MSKEFKPHLERTFTREELFHSLKRVTNRLTPQIITEMDKPENIQLFQIVLPDLQPYVLLENIASPLSLYNFFQQHNTELIIITDDVFQKRKNYLDVLEGAVCSSPDSCELWPVRYPNKPEFTFTGKIIICTKKTRLEIKTNKRFEYFARDCYFI